MDILFVPVLLAMAMTVVRLPPSLRAIRRRMALPPKKAAARTAVRAESSVDPPPPPPVVDLLPVGTRVEAKCKVGGKEWKRYYAGIITATNADASYEMTFEDGQEMHGVLRSQIKHTMAHQAAMIELVVPGDLEAVVDTKTCDGGDADPVVAGALAAARAVPQAAGPPQSMWSVELTLVRQFSLFLLDLLCLPLLLLICLTGYRMGRLMRAWKSLLPPNNAKATARWGAVLELGGYRVHREILVCFFLGSRRRHDGRASGYRWNCRSGVYAQFYTAGWHRESRHVHAAAAGGRGSRQRETCD